MANWDKITGKGNVEDRRGARPLVAGGAGIITFVIILLNIFGGNSQTAKLVSSVLSEVQKGSVASQQTAPGTFDDKTNFQGFASKVLGSNDQMWGDFLKNSQTPYTPPKLVLFREATRSGCGVATSEVGPHYCPKDQTVYLDETFFVELQTKFKAKGGDVAEAYVIAHEIAHHVQNILGVMDKEQEMTDQSPSKRFELSEKLELQADCFAGVWARSVADQKVISPEEIGQATDAAAAVGDDRVQKETTGKVNPETWTHGSSAQRVQWFNTGYNSGEPSKCDTFASSI